MANETGKVKYKVTRPDTRPIPVADGWAGAEMRVFPLSDSITMDRPTDQPTDKASYRVASPRLKMIFLFLLNNLFLINSKSIKSGYEKKRSPKVKIKIRFRENILFY